jgi:hypothetical protein
MKKENKWEKIALDYIGVPKRDRRLALAMLRVLYET